MKVFSKEAFMKNASLSEKKTLTGHTDALDGKEVVNEQVESYWVDGQEYYLYPVDDKWTKEAG